MKNILKVILSIALAIGFLNAEPLSQVGEKNDYKVKLSSQKSLIVGNNNIEVELSKDSNVITNAKVKIKVLCQKCQVCHIWIIKQKPN